MTEEPNVSAEQAVERSWLRLRRAHHHKQDNKGADRWNQIGENNHLAEAVAETYRRRRREA